MTPRTITAYAFDHRYGDDVVPIYSLRQPVNMDGVRTVTVELLGDADWWVRAAAKESLLVLGESGLQAATAMLENEDGFARDSAREVVSAFRRESRPLELAG